MGIKFSAGTSVSSRITGAACILLAWLRELPVLLQNRSLQRAVLIHTSRRRVQVMNFYAHQICVRAQQLLDGSLLAYMLKYAERGNRPYKAASGAKCTGVTLNQN